MSLTTEITPLDISPVYNPIIFQFASDVRSDYTIGPAHFVESPGNIVNNNGYIEITYDVDHGLVVGDFIKITDDGGLTGLLGVWMVKEILTTDSYVINAPYIGAQIGDIYLYKYYKNYNLVARVFTYNQCIADYEQVAKLLFKPLFADGLCYFRFDIADVLKNYSNECNTENDDISGDLIPLTNAPEIQINNKSFVSYYITYAEGYDNPVASVPEYVETIPEVD